MPGISDIFGLGRSGLVAHQAGVQIAGRNAANVNTPGYTRRVLHLSPLGLGGGSAVRVGAPSRAHDRFLFARALGEDGRLGAASMRRPLLERIESLAGDMGAGGLSALLDGFGASLRELQTAPADAAARRTVIERARALATGVSRTALDLGDLGGEIDGALRDAAVEVNAAARQIAELDRLIFESQSAGEDALDLADRRDALIRDLGRLAGGRSFADGHGRTVVTIAGGIAIVQGGRALELTAADDPDTGRVRLSVSGIDVTGRIGGGEIAGRVEVRDRLLPALAARLDALAFDLAAGVNAAQVAGVALDGAAGRPIFSTTATPAGAAAALALALDDPAGIAAASGAAGLPGDGSNLPGLAAAADALSDRAAALVADTGFEARATTDELAAIEARAAQIEALRQQQSGVSLDEELIDLARYQRAYEASARLVRTVDEMLKTLLDL